MTRTKEVIEPGSLEWFRSRMPLLILLQAFFEEPQNCSEFGFRDEIMTPSARECESEFWDLVQLAEKWAERLDDYADPNAREIVARLKGLTNCTIRPRFAYMDMDDDEQSADWKKEKLRMKARRYERTNADENRE